MIETKCSIWKNPSFPPKLLHHSDSGVIVILPIQAGTFSLFPDSFCYMNCFHSNYLINTFPHPPWVLWCYLKSSVRKKIVAILNTAKRNKLQKLSWACSLFYKGLKYSFPPSCVTQTFSSILSQRLKITMDDRINWANGIHFKILMMPWY